jgi:hypothetical protein
MKSKPPRLVRTLVETDRKTTNKPDEQKVEDFQKGGKEKNRREGRIVQQPGLGVEWRFRYSSNSKVGKGAGWDILARKQGRSSEKDEQKEVDAAEDAAS